MVSVKGFLRACAVTGALLWSGIASAQTVQLSDASAVGTDPYSSATAWYSLGSNGSVWASTPWNGAIGLGNWITPQSGMSGYEARAVDSSCYGPTTWVNLGTDRTWSISTNGWYEGEQASCSMTVQIRRISDGAILAGARVDMTAYTGWW
jgi:hypothetical protein